MASDGATLTLPEDSEVSSTTRPSGARALAARTWTCLTWERVAWAFVALGLLLRVVRFALRPPLWGDEAFVAVNLLTRDYAGLLRPLEHGMVCPLLFLWIERASIAWLGFHEYSLRLFPTVASVASVFLFRHLASRISRGAAAALAVAVFSVSFYLVRHGGEVKPYASDLLTALILWTFAIEWWRSRDDRWLWGLAAFVPVALALSHPAVFVAGGISAALGLSVRRSGRSSTLTAFVAYNVMMLAAFAGLLLLFTGPQGQSIVRDNPKMFLYWASAFPPRSSVWDLLVWLVRTHTGHLLAYPAGGDRGASLATALAVAVAVAGLARGKQWTLLAILLAPFGLTLVASALRRYPYGGSTRTVLFLAPAVCVLAGAGMAQLLARIRRPDRRRRWLGLAVVSLAGFGGIFLGCELIYPYYSVHDVRSREFARRFWIEQARDAELVCLRKDLGIAFSPQRWHCIRTPLYLCNQAIYSPQWRRTGPNWDAITPSHPLRCVLFDEHPLGKTNPAAWKELPGLDPALTEWLEHMRACYELKDSRTYVINRGVCENEIWFEDRYVVFEFTPKAGDVPRISAAFQ